VVSCRLGTTLPPLPGVAEAWVQRDDDGGPIAGLASALREAHGRPILALSISLPLMTEEVLRDLLAVAADGRSAVVPRVGDRLEPLVGRWSASALPILEGFRTHADLERVTRLVDPAQVPFAADVPAFLRVEGPEDVLRAHAALEARRTTLPSWSPAPSQLSP
jgi:molybdopterin-guanine dinucleotide biosynthesis protein A